MFEERRIEELSEQIEDSVENVLLQSTVFAGLCYQLERRVEGPGDRIDKAYSHVIDIKTKRLFDQCVHVLTVVDLLHFDFGVDVAMIQEGDVRIFDLRRETRSRERQRLMRAELQVCNPNG